MENPFAVLPAVVRKYVYLFAFLAALAVAAYQGVEQGQWAEALGVFVASLVPLLASANTPVDLAGKPKV